MLIKKYFPGLLKSLGILQWKIYSTGILQRISLWFLYIHNKVLGSVHYLWSYEVLFCMYLFIMLHTLCRNIIHMDGFRFMLAVFKYCTHFYIIDWVTIELCGSNSLYIRLFLQACDFMYKIVILLFCYVLVEL